MGMHPCPCPDSQHGLHGVAGLSQHAWQPAGAMHGGAAHPTRQDTWVTVHQLDPCRARQGSAPDMSMCFTAGNWAMTLWILALLRRKCSTLRSTTMRHRAHTRRVALTEHRSRRTVISRRMPSGSQSQELQISGLWLASTVRFLMRASACEAPGAQGWGLRRGWATAAGNHLQDHLYPKPSLVVWGSRVRPAVYLRRGDKAGRGEQGPCIRASSLGCWGKQESLLRPAECWTYTLAGW